MAAGASRCSDAVALPSRPAQDDAQRRAARGVPRRRQHRLCRPETMLSSRVSPVMYGVRVALVWGGHDGAMMPIRGSLRLPHRHADDWCQNPCRIMAHDDERRPWRAPNAPIISYFLCSDARRDKSASASHDSDGRYDAVLSTNGPRARRPTLQASKTNGQNVGSPRGRSPRTQDAATDPRARRRGRALFVSSKG